MGTVRNALLASDGLANGFARRECQFIAYAPYLAKATDGLGRGGGIGLIMMGRGGGRCLGPRHVMFSGDHVQIR